MCPVKEETIRDCIINFIHATSNEALAVRPCAVCARETSATDLVPHTMDEVPHPELLIPHTPHAKHDLFDGMLLYPDGVRDESIDICNDCSASLQDNA